MTRGTDISQLKRAYRSPVEGDFPEELTLHLRRTHALRYGENPMQFGAIYTNGGDLAEFTNLRLVKSGKGGVSATNFMDVVHAMKILAYFPRESVAVMKHLIPSGFATQTGEKTLDQLYVDARDTDARSAFGSVVVFNTPVDKATAEALSSTYVEGVAAPSYQTGVVEILEQKKNLRLMQFSNLAALVAGLDGDLAELVEARSLPSGNVLVQLPYASSILGSDNLVFNARASYEGEEHMVERDPTEREVQDMLTAWYVNFGVRSNGIVLVKDGVTLAVGSGQQERVGAVEQAIVKAYQKAMDREHVGYDPLEGAIDRDLLSVNPLDGAVASSDGFFPFRDSVDALGMVGVKGIIQPGGSVRDAEVIAAVNEYDMAMAVTRERCFGHF